ncbi:ABC transporter permease subunit [Humibacillus sp. DSM 29435]|uniref:ABC transporter permease subunit n=1 Tax=Humibacillus sp. DSM 29435 TaxID=1869167 RepID=UPI000A84B1AA|nr:ABC transporter permease subunit [Humibacillus sp. DSM 29435]
MTNQTMVPADPRPRAQVRPGGISFIGLVGVELRRLWWRRLTKVAIVGVIAFVGLATYGVYEQTNPEAVAQRIDSYNSMVAEMKQQQQSMTAEDKAAQISGCRTDEAAQKAVDPSADFNCEQVFGPPSPEDFGLTNPATDELIRGVAQSAVYLLGFLSFLLAASFIAAEFSSGSMGNWLTFQPRRLRVAASKLTASTIAGALLAVFGLALTALAVSGVATVNRPDASLKLPEALPSNPEPLALALLRIVAVVALGGLGGAAIGLIARSTAAVVGLVLGYGVVVEGFIANGIGDGRLRPWFVSLNIDAFVQNGATYYVNVCNADGCQGLQLKNSFTHGWVYLLIVAVVGVVAALAIFRRRDVT